MIMILLLLLVFASSLILCVARDMINMSNPLISDGGDTLVSAGNTFEFGVFTPEGKNKNNKSYVGIWYYKSNPRTVVWVANRDNPLPYDSCGGGIIDLAPDGNLKVRCKDGFVFHVTSFVDNNNNRTLQLQDSGNLVLLEYGGTSDIIWQSFRSEIIWQSFDRPTDTFLPGMKMGDGMELVSWTGPNDPGYGSYKFRLDQGGYFIQNRSKIYWRSGELGMFSPYNELPHFVAQMLSSSSPTSENVSAQSYLMHTSSLSHPRSMSALHHLTAGRGAHNTVGKEDNLFGTMRNLSTTRV